MNNKKIVFHVTNQYMKKNKGRTLTTFLGIVCMVLLMTCVLVGKASVFRYMQRTAELDKGKWHMNLYDVDANQYEQIKELPYVDQTAVSRNLGYSQFDSENKNKPFLFVKSYSENDFDWMNISLSEGRLPENNKEAVICKNAIEDGNTLKVGDSIPVKCFTRSLQGTDPKVGVALFPFYSLQVTYHEPIEAPLNFPYVEDNESYEEIHTDTGFEENYTIVGVIEQPEYETVDCPYYSMITCEDHEIAAGEKANVSLTFHLKNLKHYDYISDIREIMGDQYEHAEVNNLVLVFSSASSQSSINILADAIVIFFTVLIIIISMVLIYNVFNISYDERRKYLGMLSSIGATKAQKKCSIYYEAFLLLVSALPIGILLGVGIVKAGLMGLKPYLMVLAGVSAGSKLAGVSTSISISIYEIIAIVLLSSIAVLISSYLPARKIEKVGPIESIKGNEEKSVKRFRNDKKSFLKGKVEKLLANNQLHYQKQKTKSIVRSMTVFMAIVVVTTFGANSVTKLVEYKLIDNVTVADQISDYDFRISEQGGAGGTYAGIKNEVLSSSHVSSVRESYMSMWGIGVDKQFFGKEYWDAMHEIANRYGVSEEEFAFYNDEAKDIGVWSIDDALFEKLAKSCESDGSLVKNSDANPVLVYQNTELSTDNMRYEGHEKADYFFQELEKTTDLEIGDQFTAYCYNTEEEKPREMQLTVAGYAKRDDIKDYVSFHNEKVWILTNNSTAAKLNEELKNEESVDEDGNNNTICRNLYVSFDDMNCESAVKLSELTGEKRDDIVVQTGEDMLSGSKEGIENITSMINLMVRIAAVGFIVFSSMICFLNMFNSIRARKESRKRDMAMLRSVGMTQKQIDKMIAIENVKMAVRSMIWAAIITAPMIFLLRYFFITLFGSVILPVPLLACVAALVLSMGSLFIISKICYRGKETDNIIEEIRRETMASVKFYSDNEK